MGLTAAVELKKYDFEELKNKLLEHKKINNPERLEKILLIFGERVANTYFILKNELYDDGNCYNNVLRVLEVEFDIPDDDKSIFDTFYELEHECNDYIRLEDVRLYL